MGPAAESSEFFEFYFPEVHAAVDFHRPPEFLDSELRQIAPAAERSRRHLDRLLKVALKAGGEQWLFVHVEIQGETASGSCGCSASWTS